MANKAQALEWLALQLPIVRVGTPVLVATHPEFGDKTYRVNVKKVQAEVVRYENIHFVVEDEGGAGEVAYFLNNNTIAWTNSHETGTTAP